jgi:hypothetical protein
MMNPQTVTFSEAAREPTGTHFLDSGGESGRSWQQPPLPEDAPIIRMDARYPLEPTIETGPFLDSCVEIDRDLQTEFEGWVESFDGDWFSAGAEFMEGRGFVQVARDNVYNGENDLSQVYVYEVYLPSDIEGADWIYSDDAVAVFYLHTGADVRGGYGRPIFGRGRGDYTIPADLVIGVHVLDSRENGFPGSYDQWEIGYTSAPLYSFSDEVERVFGWTLNLEDCTVCVKMKSGERLHVQFYTAADWQ